MEGGSLPVPWVKKIVIQGGGVGAEGRGEAIMVELYLNLTLTLIPTAWEFSSNEDVLKLKYVDHEPLRPNRGTSQNTPAMAVSRINVSKSTLG